MKDIARDLGVSLMTVSKALRHHADISAATRSRVLRRAAELHYQPNWLARGLATRRSYLIGLVIPDLMHSFFAEAAKGMAGALEAAGYQVLIADTGEDPEAERRHIERLLARNVDGLVVASAEPRRVPWLGALEERRIPCILIDRPFPGARASFVGVKDEDIGLLATAHLLEQGCRRIAHIQGPPVATAAGRLRGYQLALRRRRLPAPAARVVPGSGIEGGYRAMRRLLDKSPRPDGVFCYNDPAAAGAMQAALDTGLDVPRDLAIVGAGNVRYSDLLRVPLSTVDQSSLLMGGTAAGLLTRFLAADTPPAPQTILLPPRLIVRESSRRIAP